MANPTVTHSFALWELFMNYLLPFLPISPQYRFPITILMHQLEPSLRSILPAITISAILAIAFLLYPPYFTVCVNSEEEIYSLLSTYFSNSVKLNSYNVGTDFTQMLHGPNTENGSLKYTLGFGTHWHWKRWAQIFRINHTGEKASIQQPAIQTLTITCYGRSSRDGIRALYRLAGFSENDFSPNETNIFVPTKSMARNWTGAYWRLLKSQPEKASKSVIMDEKVKKQVLGDIKTFFSDEEKKAYNERGERWKRGYLLHGIPGSGKTSFIEFVASVFHLDIYTVDLASEHSDDLRDLICAIPQPAIVVFEDIRASTFCKLEENYNPMSPYRDLSRGILISTFLNLIDGVLSPEGNIMIMTTNHLQELRNFSTDLLRPGRIDVTVEFGCISRAGAEKMFENFTNNVKLAKKFGASIPENEFTPAQLQAYLTLLRKEPKKAVKDVASWVRKERKNAKSKKNKIRKTKRVEEEEEEEDEEEQEEDDSEDEEK